MGKSKSYKAGLELPGEPNLFFNALRFATEDEVDTYVTDLLSRWDEPTGYEIVPSDDEPNYRIVDRRLERIKEDDNA